MCNPYAFPRGCFSALWATLRYVSVIGAVTSGGGIGAAISGLGPFPHPHILHNTVSFRRRAHLNGESIEFNIIND
jgi:hypothetical protein